MGKIVVQVRQARLNYQQRIGRTVSIQEVAKDMGISRAALSNIENGHTKEMSFDLLAKLCEFYDVKPGDLLDYEEWLAQLIAARSGDTTNWVTTETLASAN